MGKQIWKNIFFFFFFFWGGGGSTKTCSFRPRTPLTCLSLFPPVLLLPFKPFLNNICFQVVMGYGHNKLSLEEAEELLKEVNYSQKKGRRDIDNLMMVMVFDREGWPKEKERVLVNLSPRLTWTAMGNLTTRSLHR